VKFAGHFYVSPFSGELRRAPVEGGPAIRVLDYPTRETRTIDYAARYVSPMGETFCGPYRRRDEYERATYVRVASEDTSAVDRAALAAVMFTAEPRVLEDA